MLDDMGQRLLDWFIVLQRENELRIGGNDPTEYRIYPDTQSKVIHGGYRGYSNAQYIDNSVNHRKHNKNVHSKIRHIKTVKDVNIHKSKMKRKWHKRKISDELGHNDQRENIQPFAMSRQKREHVIKNPGKICNIDC